MLLRQGHRLVRVGEQDPSSHTEGPKKERDSTIYDITSTSDPCSDKQSIVPTQNKSGGVG